MILDDFDGITALLANTQRIAVLGIKTEEQADQPAFYVPKACQEMGFTIVPVPVYYPEATVILGEKVYRKLADVPPTVDMVNIFRRKPDVPAHLDDILAAKPKSVWMQQMIRREEVAAKLSAAGITVVMDRCLMVELRLRPELLRTRSSTPT